MSESEQSSPFWRRKRLAEMTVVEWESLCDGCAKCCLQKLGDEEGNVYYTELSCNLLDGQTCRCTNYQNRHELVPECVWLTPEDLDEFDWLPPTCAYRRLAEGRDLPDWHPLKTGRSDSAIQAGYSVCGRSQPVGVIAEEDWQEHLAEWPLEESP